ncbi:glycerol-3-phosphate acyltransferase [Bacteroidetes/Chlorobi group bacterium MS-B_bin-24]|jgi:glycerol-3-phosphate acyltransferase PlsY|nr:MAG: glycerol-3-phosphate acyltransferase [Bacteroidetes/Chlorobi group bacterium MS-B_bin-24]
MSKYLIIFALSYIVGSIPFAYIIVRLFFRKDISKEGSGNVGAMNSYEVTGRKWVGFLVFLFDFLKGISVVLISRHLIPDDDFAILAASFSVVLGHNFSLFLRFKGGKGLATSAGVLLLIQPIILLLWVILWLLIYNFVKKDMDIANPATSVISPFLFFVLPEDFVRKANIIPFLSRMVLYITIGLLALLILSKYFIVLKLKLSKK